MPKKKTKRTVAKRFKRTAGGKIMRHRAGKRHLLGGKSRQRKRRLRKAASISKADYGRMKDLI